MNRVSRFVVLRGRLTVDLPVALGRFHILPALNSLMAKHPEMTVTTTLNDRHVDLINEGYDVVIRIGEPEDSSLVGRRLAKIKYVVCASPGYLDTFGRPETLQDLERHRCVTFVPTPGARPAPWRFAGAEGAGRSIDLRVEGPLSVNNAEALVEAAVAGIGLVQLHSYLANPVIANGGLVPVLEEFTSRDGPPIYALYPSARQISPKVRAFIDFAADLFSPIPIWERAIPGQTLAGNVE